jgi:hypothetical protein
MKYRKKPVVIEAFKLSDLSTDATMMLPGWVLPAICDRSIDVQSDGGAIIKSPEGDHRANPEDWVIRGVKGELYACKPDIFELTYEAVTP